jgi:DNA-binding GntR family transcriptional regulator
MASAGKLKTDQLMKDRLADLLREEIVKGVLRPGDRVIEAKWAATFQAAPGSIREAIHILSLEGYLFKSSGHSARVVHLTPQDVSQLYELRGALEGLAARLAAARSKDFSELQTAVIRMRAALRLNDRDLLLKHDLRFHLELCRLADNIHLQEHAYRVLMPFFAFAQLRIAALPLDLTVWEAHFAAHQRIIDLLRDGEGELAEQYVRRAMRLFEETTSMAWGGIDEMHTPRHSPGGGLSLQAMVASTPGSTAR